MDPLDPHSPVPLYHQVKVALRREIEAGHFQVGQPIPPERELIEQFGVSRITVRQALAELEADGLLERRHGKGTYVAPTPVRPIAETLSELTGHLEELQRQGFDPQSTVLSLERRPMPAHVAEALGRAPGAEGWFLHRLVSAGGGPLMLSEVWIPCDLGLTVDAQALATKGMAQLLTEQGREPVKGSQRIGAQVVGPEEAALLKIDPGDPVLRVVRVISGAGGSPLVWFRTLYRADRYEYEVELKRRR